ncbi:hypothetical protein Pfo_020860 [Paulownia fortunei]|nr:hypothetical protein Pfo_020860 [Paulownia fortunei]
MPLHWPRLWGRQQRRFHSNRVFSTLKTSMSQVPPELRSANRKITELIRGDRLDDARAFFNKLSQRNTVTWNSMLSGYVQCREIAKARMLFDEMPVKDIVSWNLMISGYVSCRGRRYVEEGRYLFDKMPERDFVSWNTMISGYAKNGRMDDALRLFNSMPERNVVTWNAMITGFERNVVSWNSMIMSYVKDGDTASARELFDRMEDRDTVSWNTMISGYVHVSDMEAAIKLFSEMATPDALSWNSIISGFAQAGKMELALDFFQRMPQKNQVSWNTIIAGYEKNAGFKEAIELFVHMQVEGEKPDRHTLSSLLSICAESAAQHLGVQIHQLVTKIVIPDVPLNNSLITMYARCGAISEAKTVFNEMKFQKNVISWNAMIGGYASHGFAKEALELFESMKWFEVTPTYITFTSVLSACAHGGLVEEGRSYFRSMICDFGIEPRAEHFASLVDVVGRYGQVEEAMDIISRMPIEPDKAVWGALLGACRVHNNVELARVAAEALMKLEPESSGPYVLLYNMYADAERWNDADEIRMMMEKNNIKKERGYSRVDSSCS